MHSIKARPHTKQYHLGKHECTDGHSLKEAITVV